MEKSDKVEYFRNYVLPVIEELHHNVTMKNVRSYDTYVSFGKGLKGNNTTYHYFINKEVIIQLGYNKSDNETWELSLNQFIKNYCKEKKVLRGLSNEEFVALLKQPF